MLSAQDNLQPSPVPSPEPQPPQPPAEPTPPTPETPLAEPVVTPTPAESQLLAPSPIQTQPITPSYAEAPEGKPAITPTPVEPQPSAPTPAPTPEPASVQEQASTPVITGLSGLLTRAKEKIQFRKRAKLEKIMVLAQSKGKITNNDIEKLLRVSDATATRYLSQLIKEGKLKRSGTPERARYEPL